MFPIVIAIKAIATVTSCDGRKVTFDVEAYDNAGLIGKGTHERFSVKIDKFMLKAEERKNISTGLLQNLILENRGKLSISGVLDVLSFDDQVVIVETELRFINSKRR